MRGGSSQWCTVDLSNSDAWLRLHVAKAPTVTASHNTRSIFVTHPVDRFLLPQVGTGHSSVPAVPVAEDRLVMRQHSTAYRTHARTHATVRQRRALLSLPQEHMLLQGFYWEQVQAASAAFKDAPHAMARIAGNAIPMETNMVSAVADRYRPIDRVLLEYPAGPDRGTH